MGDLDPRLRRGAGAGRWYFPTPVAPREFTGVLVPEGLGWIEGGSNYTVAVASQPARFRDVRDGLASTLVLAESGDYSLDGGGSWAAPRYSWPYVTDCGRFVGWGAGDSGTPLERSLKPRSRIGGGVTQCLSGDGAVRAIDDGIPTAVLVALTSRAGDEAVVAP